MPVSNNRQPKLDYDVIVVGGGMVGLALTAKLAQLDLRVAVIDPKPVELEWEEGTIDPRVSAITRASQQLFQDIDAWQLINDQDKSAYQRMFVWDGESSRGKIELFDFGGSVEELKAKCLSDTHLEPPTTPIFQKWMTLSANDNKS